MNTLNTKVNQINQKFKNNAIVSGVINLIILGLVFVFFSIGFDLTKNVFTNLLELSWASIFPSLLDLGTIAGLIFVLKSIANNLAHPDFFLHLDDKETDETKIQAQIIQFLNNKTIDKLTLKISFIVSLLAINFFANLLFELGNNQLSPLNEWYLLSSQFTHLPIFPINLLCIVILIAIVLPTALNYAKYKVEIVEAANLPITKSFNKDKFKSVVSDLKYFRGLVFIVLSIICIVLSIFQRKNVWIFQYNQPISENSVLVEKSEGESFSFCGKDIQYHIAHKQNVMSIKSYEKDGFGATYTKESNYVITPQLKESILAKCNESK